MRNYARSLDPLRRVPPDAAAASDMDFVNGQGQGFPPMSSSSGVVGGPQQPPRVTPAGESPFVRLIYPPRIEKLPTSADFYTADYQVAVGAGVNTTATSAAMRFQLPETMVGFLQQFSVYVLSSLATTRLKWSVRINQGPVTGFDGILNPPGVANLVILFFNDMRIRIPNHGTVDIVITNLDGAAITAGGSLAGWYHPQADEIRMYGPEGTG